MRRKIYFRADSSPEIGYGHFIRSLALASILKEDFECVFFTQTPSSNQKQQVKEVCNLIELPADDRKFGLFLQYLSGEEIVVLDNYFYSVDYQQQIKEKGCKLVCFAGIREMPLLSDLAINCWGVERDLFQLIPTSKYLSGIEWAPLREEFLHVERKKILNKKFPEKIVIAFGGIDYYNLTEKFVGLFDQMENVKIVIAIVGEMHPIKMEEFSAKVSFKKNVSAKEITEIFLNADLGVIPSSTMLIEALSCGLPVVSGYYVDNQILPYETLRRKKQILGVGNFLANDVKNKIHTILLNDYFSYLSNLPYSYNSLNRKEKFVEEFSSL